MKTGPHLSHNPKYFLATTGTGCWWVRAAREIERAGGNPRALGACCAAFPRILARTRRCPKQSSLPRSPRLPRPAASLQPALASVRAPEFGSQLGLAFERGLISDADYNTGKRWSALTRDYAEATQAPRPPRSIALDAASGAAPDPDSERGLRQVRCHLRIVDDDPEAHEALRGAGCAMPWPRSRLW